MGLDTTHDCWHGSYTSFHLWRTAIACAAGFPPLDLMEGHWDERDRKSASLADRKKKPPISWTRFRRDPLTVLLKHSDCDGKIAWKNTRVLANRLAELKPDLPEKWHYATNEFIKGLRRAYREREDVEFH